VRYSWGMRLLFLNSWDARQRDELVEFIQDQTETVDVFCFQEAEKNMQQVCRELLGDYQEFRAHKYISDKDEMTQTTYVRRGIEVSESGEILQGQKDVGLGLYVQLASEAGPLYVCNFHGMSRPVDKLDNPGRIEASRKLIEYFKHKPLSIIGGDFNMLPDTEAIRMFSEEGFQDLIEEYGIPTTRNHLIWDLYPDTKQYYADYVFLSPGLQVREFLVPDNTVSDHLPQIVDVDLRASHSISGSLSREASRT
jgi:endonuclease/exonuclease/phosphatase family metal-dependent hydrolase